MAIRTNSEKNIEHDFFKLKIGTTNKIKPEIIYFEGKTFIKPNEEMDNYNSGIVDIKRKFQQTIKNTLSETKLFNNNYILDFQVAKNGISPNKKSYLSFQLLFKQKNGNSLMKLNEAKKATGTIMSDVLNELTNEIERHNFSVTKTK